MLCTVASSISFHMAMCYCLSSRLCFCFFITRQDKPSARWHSGVSHGYLILGTKHRRHAHIYSTDCYVTLLCLDGPIFNRRSLFLCAPLQTLFLLYCSDRILILSVYSGPKKIVHCDTLVGGASVSFQAM